jgi:hypothetical protein
MIPMVAYKRGTSQQVAGKSWKGAANFYSPSASAYGGITFNSMQFPSYCGGHMTWSPSVGIHQLDGFYKTKFKAYLNVDIITGKKWDMKSLHELAEASLLHGFISHMNHQAKYGMVGVDHARGSMERFMLHAQKFGASWFPMVIAQMKSTGAMADAGGAFDALALTTSSGISKNKKHDLTIRMRDRDEMNTMVPITPHVEGSQVFHNQCYGTGHKIQWWNLCYERALVPNYRGGGSGPMGPDTDKKSKDTKMYTVKAYNHIKKVMNTDAYIRSLPSTYGI